MPPGNRLQALEEPKFLRAVRNKKVLGLLVIHKVRVADQRKSCVSTLSVVNGPGMVRILVVGGFLASVSPV
jgi:hypothetical protein